jgi:lysophospholipase L1-like esterase
MDRLLAFGCSLTYGEGLEDCYGENVSMPSKLAWPSLIAKELNREVLNLGIRGASNKLIWYTILNTEIHETDLVIILWTTPHRYCFFRDDESVLRLLPADIQRTHLSFHKTTKFYYKNLHSDFDSQIDTYNRINYINYYLKSKNIKSYHFIDTGIFSGGCNFEPSWNETKILSVKFDPMLKSKYDKYHPNEESHEKFAKDMLKTIQRIENES